MLEQRGLNSQHSIPDFLSVHAASQGSQRYPGSVNRAFRFPSFVCATYRPCGIAVRLAIELRILVPGATPWSGATPRLGSAICAARGCRTQGAAQWARAPCTGGTLGGVPATHAVGCQNPFSKFPHTKSASCWPLGAPRPGAAGPGPKTTSRVYEKGRPKGSPSERQRRLSVTNR